MTIAEVEQGDALKSGDTEPDLVVQLRKDSGTPYTLDNHAVRLFIKEVDGDELLVDDDLDGNVTIENIDNARVSYSWQSGDTDKAATYLGEVEVEELDEQDAPNGRIATFPSEGYFKVRIQESLD